MDKFNPFRFDGRIGRLQYLGYSILMGFLVGVLVAIFSMGSYDAVTGQSGPVGLVLGSIVMFIASASYGVRRLHDMNASGWWYLLTFIPVLNFVMALVLLFAPPSPGTNRYGTR